MPDTPEPPAPTTPVVDPLPEGPLPAVAPRWDEPRHDVAEGTEDGGGALTGLPAGWRETLVARPGILAGALVAGVLIGLAGGYALWGGRPGASAPPPTPTATPATSSKQGVTEPALNVAVPPQPAPRTEAPPVPREAADPPARPATAAPTAVRTAPREVSTAPRAATTAQRGAPARAAVPPPPVTPASLEVASRPPGARVVVDGRVAGKTPLRLDKVAAGPHTVRLELEGYAPWATTVTLTAGQAARVAGSLERVQR